MTFVKVDEKNSVTVVSSILLARDQCLRMEKRSVRPGHGLDIVDYTRL
jgi:hypothetical protein